MGTHHPLRIFSGTANRPLAEAVARILDTELGKCTTTRLKDSEIHVAIDEAVRDQDVFIIQPCSAPVNDHLMELVLYIDAFRRASAHEITAVIPYYPYGRQERMAKGREAISAKVVAVMLEAMGVSRVIYFDVHAPATQGFFQVPVDPLSALPVLAAYFDCAEFRNAAIVSPDVGRAKFAGAYAERLHLPLVVMHKRRASFEQAEATHVVGDIQGKVPIIIDDIIAGGSVLDEVDGLIKAGAQPEVYLSITHGVLLPSALERIDRDDRIKRVVISDTICQPEAIRQHEKITIVSVAELLARVIGRIHVGESISSLLSKQ
jgi:ribose-phosphate pyrophosphokinase